MWAKFKTIEPMEYVQGKMVRENIAESDGTVRSRQYEFELTPGPLYTIISTRKKSLGRNSQYIMEFTKNEDIGTIGEPPRCRLVTNLDQSPCRIDFFKENPEANIYYAQEGVAGFEHADFTLDSYQYLRQFESILIDSTLPTRFSFAKKIILQEWRQNFSYVRQHFDPWLA